jgi:hypothetical protein
MYRWELDGMAQQEFADLPPAARVFLAAFMDVATPRAAFPNGRGTRWSDGGGNVR